jgi:acyl carrier protein
MASEHTVAAVKDIIGEALGLGERARGYDAHTALLGAVPEFDSIAVVTVLGMVEERFDIDIMDDEVDTDAFESIGALADFVERKLAG